MMTQLDLLTYTVPLPRCNKPNKAHAERVLKLLRTKGLAGVTWDDFPPGFALRSRISDLKKAGHDIKSIPERLEGGATRARYVLMGEG